MKTERRVMGYRESSPNIILEDYFQFQFNRLKPTMVIMVGLGFLVILLTAAWDLRPSSIHNIWEAMVYRFYAVVPVLLMLLPVYLERLKPYFVIIILCLGLLSLSFLLMNFMMLPDLIPYIPSLLPYFMMGILIIAPLAHWFLLMIAILWAYLEINFFLYKFDLLEEYFSLFVIFSFLPSIFLFVTSLRVKKVAQDNYDLYKETALLAITDPLSQLMNCRSWENRAESQLEQCLDENKLFAVVICDIDFFKKVNDQYGHLVGDTTIKAVADIITRNSREDDLIGRLGGDEFIIAFSHLSQDSVLNICERLRLEVEGGVINHENGENIMITMSIGVAFSRSDDQNAEQNKLVALMKRSDAALYLAKDRGRNCIVVE